MQILGSGAAALVAGSIFQNSKILEPLDSTKTHRALLRFRSPAIGEAVGIPFQQVKVYKGIWHNDGPVNLSPRYISLYSRKVSDTIGYRSITKLDPETRWIAPEDFHERLLDQCHNRIEYNAHIEFNDVTISTLPIFILAKMLNFSINIPKEKLRPIYVSRFRIPDCNVYMTYYYTDPTVHCYRASITKDILIIESMWPLSGEDLKAVTRSFGLTGLTLEMLCQDFQQENGKMVAIDEHERKNFILNATIQHNVYSLGRFATWRNLVLDDVFTDINKIKLLINEGHYAYFRSKV
jgi:hypothetical protein